MFGLETIKTINAGARALKASRTLKEAAQRHVTLSNGTRRSGPKTVITQGRQHSV